MPDLPSDDFGDASSSDSVPDPTPPDYDGAWKNALDAYFPEFMALLWPRNASVGCCFQAPTQLAFERPSFFGVDGEFQYFIAVICACATFMSTLLLMNSILHL